MNNSFIIKNILKREASYVNSFEIETLLGITGAQVREIINKLRKDGEPIISSNLGYKWTTSEIEISQCVDSLFSRSDEIRKVGKSLLETLNALQKKERINEEKDSETCERIL